MTPDQQYEEARMSLKNWMYEYPIAFCDSTGEVPGIPGDGETYYVNSRLIATLLHFLYEETLSSDNGRSGDYIEGTMMALSSFTELMIAVKERIMPLTVPESFGGGPDGE